MEEDLVFGEEERKLSGFRQFFGHALQVRVLRAQTDLMEPRIFFVESANPISGSTILDITPLVWIS